MLKLVANPTFIAKVEIPAPGAPVSIKVEFKHMTRDAYNAYVKADAESPKANEDAIMDIAVGWVGVDGEFNRENIAQLCQLYHAAPRAIMETFVRELTQYKVGN